MSQLVMPAGGGTLRPADVRGQGLLDSQRLLDKALPYQPPLIAIRRGESLLQMVARAEAAGIGRECVHCGFKRRFSKVNCPACGSCQHSQVRVKALSPDAERIAEEFHDSLPKEDVDFNAAQVNSGYEYKPQEDPDKQRPAPEASPTIPNDTRPLHERSLRELQGLAAALEVQLGGCKTKAQVIARLEENAGGLSGPAPTTAQQQAAALPDGELTEGPQPDERADAPTSDPELA